MHRKRNRRLTCAVWSLCLLAPVVAQAKAKDQTVKVSIEVDQPEHKRQTITLEVPIDGQLSAKGSLSGRDIYCRATVTTDDRAQTSAETFHAQVECGHRAKDPDGLFEVRGRTTLPANQTKNLGSIASGDGSKIRVKLRRA